jgi:hypothetical protein
LGVFDPFLERNAFFLDQNLLAYPVLIVVIPGSEQNVIANLNLWQAPKNLGVNIAMTVEHGVANLTRLG